MAKRRATRLGITVSREMTIALEMLAVKTGLSLTTQALVILRQGLDRTINSEPVQIRLKQERAFRTNEDWLADQSTETFVNNALIKAGGDTDAAEPLETDTHLPA